MNLNHAGTQLGKLQQSLGRAWCWAGQQQQRHACQDNQETPRETAAMSAMSAMAAMAAMAEMAAMAAGAAACDACGGHHCWPITPFETKNACRH